MNPPTTTTGTFVAGDTASGVAAKAGLSPSDFLKYNPDLAAAGHPNDYQGLTGLVQEGQTYNLGPASSQLINTSTGSRTLAASNNADLTAALSKLGGGTQNPNGTVTAPTTGAPTPATPAPQTDPFLASLDSLSATSDAATKSLIASTQAQYQNQINSTTKQYENYKLGLQQLGIEHNEAQSSPDLLAGHILQAGNDEAAKISSIQANEQKALMDATVAKNNNDFKTLNEKMTYYKQLQTEKAAAIKAAHDNIVSAGKQLNVDSAALYQAFTSIDPTQGEDFIKQVAAQYGASPLTVQSILLNEKAKEDKAALSTQNTKDIMANRGKSTTATGGVSKAQIAQGVNILKTGKKPDGTVIGNPQGKDGYVDPGIYSALFNDWPGTNAAFLKAYPVTQVNPLSYDLLPEAIQPKAKTSSGNSSDPTK